MGWSSVMPGTADPENKLYVTGCASHSMWAVGCWLPKLRAHLWVPRRRLEGLSHGRPSSTVLPLAPLHVCCWSSAVVIPRYTGVPIAVCGNLPAFPFNRTPHVVKSGDLTPQQGGTGCGCGWPIGLHRYHIDGQSQSSFSENRLCAL